MSEPVELVQQKGIEVMMTEPDWQLANKASWNERVAVHLGPGGYDLSGLRAGRGHLGAIVESELPPVSGKRVLHLLCHFGADTLSLAQRGADVVGLDFSPAAIEAATALAVELGLSQSARFVVSELGDAPAVVCEPAGFDMIFITWGALTWLPDIQLWARVVAHFLRPSGSVYLAEQHPTALVFDDRASAGDGQPGYYAPYFFEGAFIDDDDRDYADKMASLRHTKQYNFMHPLADVITALLTAGLRLDWIHEHDGIGWSMFAGLNRSDDGLYRWPDQRWLPLAYSLSATLTERGVTTRFARNRTLRQKARKIIEV